MNNLDNAPETLSIREAARVMGYKDPRPILKLVRAGELSDRPLVPGGERRIYRKQLLELRDRRCQ